MIHNDIQNQLQLLIKTSAPPLVEVADHAVVSPQWTPGQQIPAHVLASLPNGRFQVQVGDQVLDLNLPKNTQPGESLELTYVSNSPRLTFALVRDLPNPQPVNTPVSLSQAAKFIGNLLQPAASPHEPATPQPASATQPQTSAVPLSRVVTAIVLSTPPADIPAFAQALKSSVAQSGLFYEAHQVQWLNGERNLSSLKQEPQGQLPPLSPNVGTSEPSVRPVSSAHQPINVPLNSPDHPGLDQTKIQSNNQSPGQVPQLPQPSEKPVVETVHPQSVPLVQQQLQALDTRQVIWQGEVWPGQQMHWEIEEELNRQAMQQEVDTPTWHTRLNLQLPALGGVSAKLAFVNGTVQLDISADSSKSTALMRQSQTDLAERFASSGLQLSGVTIQHG